MVEVALDDLPTQLAGAGFLMKQDVLARPLNVARRGTWTLVAALTGKAYLLEQPGTTA